MLKAKMDRAGWGIYLRCPLPRCGASARLARERGGYYVRCTCCDERGPTAATVTEAEDAWDIQVQDAEEAMGGTARYVKGDVTALDAAIRAREGD
jgi:hypothetical protein